MKGTIFNHNKPIKDLHIGSFDDIITLCPNTSYIQAIETLINFNIYLAPIMDYGKFYGLFSRKTAVKYLIKSLDDRV